MRIALVSKEFVPFMGWGAGTYAALASQALADAGHEVHVLTMRKEAVSQGPGLRPGVRFHWVNDTRKHLCVPGHLGLASRYSLAVLDTLRTLHAKHPFDVIEFPDFDAEGYWPLRARQATGELAGALLTVRLHMTLQDIRPLDQQHWLDPEQAVVAHVENATILGADAVVACSHAMLERTRARLGNMGALRDRAAVVHNPFDMHSSLAELSPDAPAEARPAHWSPQDQEVLFIGRVERRKGPQVLVEAGVELLEAGLPVRIRFVGADTPTGPIESSMIRWLRTRIPPRWADRFVFEDAQWPRSRLGPAVKRAAVCCFPSLWENFPYACLEAMALGACVVGSDSGGMAEMIEHERSGLLTRVREGEDASCLALTLGRALRDDRLRAACTAEAPRRVASLCNPASIAAQMVQAWDAMRCASQSAPAPASARERGVPSQTSDVAVIVPIFDPHPFLAPALASVARQTMPPRELIIVVDGCSDPKMLSEICELERGGVVPGSGVPLRVLRQANKGLGAARNAGIAATGATWILPLDSDDVLHEKFLERTVLAAERNPGVAFVGTLVSRFHESPDLATMSDIYTPLGLDRDLLCVRNIASCATVLLHRQRVLDAGGYAVDLVYEDWDLYCTLAERGATCMIVPDILFHHRVRPGSLMHQVDPRRHQLLRARLLERHPSLALHPQRALRMLAGDMFDARPEGQKPHHQRADARALANAIIQENIRYRVADRINLAAKRLGVHAALKSLAKIITRGPHA